MINPWENIDLSDYENHMSQPNIAQAQYISNFIKEKIEIYRPTSFCYLGCSGGNGLEHLTHSSVNKIICLDINEKFLSEANARYQNLFKDIEFISADILSNNFTIKKVDFIFAALIFEYVKIEKALKNIYKMMNNKSLLAIIFQLPNKNIPEVSPSKYKSLEILSDIFSFVDINEFLILCKNYNLEVCYNQVSKLDSGKSFKEIILQKN